MDTVIEQLNQISAAAKKLSLELNTTKVTTTPAKQIMLELAQLAINNTNCWLYLSVDLAANSFVSCADVYSVDSYRKVDGASCRFSSLMLDESTFLADLLAYKEKVLANIELAKQQQRLAEEKCNAEM
ncbi:hypothetical protein GLP30_09405 [Photobacterium phosphoreum]|uniref:Uncharacterized protein n=1 Tax=Photobacterium phosphoreum TaxID=659 RepID=A0AAW4ZS35_PHOPO|nr:hypothetical protein [Photobacterium phosphoreum]MCD9491086.1 hypothetical protein [Photobacterium phosphoreum]MCF2190304.1 hypothetical protein [Photobacterium phosphoreum]MCF2300891.1 hypothetical protein [Photobacterium phosphoreum]